MDAWDDLAKQFVAIKFTPEVEKQKQMMEVLSKTYYPLWLKSMTKRLEENSSHKYFVGDSMTTADFVFAGRHFGLVQNPLNPFSVECRKLFD